MKRSAILRLLPLIFALACGRTGFGNVDDGCPADRRLPDGTCLLPDGAKDGGIDGFNVDGFCPPGAHCMFDDGGHLVDGGHGDAGDNCGIPSNCSDPECLGDPRCHQPGSEVCNNGIDDDDDGLIDCKDPDCATFPGCLPHVCNATMPDCTDPACVSNPLCQDLTCHPTVNFGTLQAHASSATKTVNTSGTTDVAVTPCAPGGAGMVVAEFTLAATADVTLAFTQGSGEDHVFGLFRAGVNQACGDNPVTCYDPKSAPSGNHTYSALAAGHYYLIAQPFESAGAGTTTITLSTATLTEICNNGIDDNGNGLIDCADGDCKNAANCLATECTPDFNVGALIANGPKHTVSFNTNMYNADNTLAQGDCVAAKGKDVVIRFTLQQTAQLLLELDQSGDHVVTIARSPAPGEKCDSDQIDCFDPSGESMSLVQYDNEPPGDYEVIVKALHSGNEGDVSVTLSAVANRQIELCHNGIDDDGNGLIDCADPACMGVSGCSAPFCMPDQNLGTMSIGDSQEVQLNLSQNGKAGYKVSCSQGNGKGEVIQLTVVDNGQNAQGGIGIGFECDETGDQVIDLFLAGGPRDACDVNEITCADPKVLSFGCNYEVPNLQPGTYNVIVQSFQPGSEGTMNLNIFIVGDRQLEICNNGIDDDGDGKIDCADLKCVTSPFCENHMCRPDQTINPMPLTGMNVTEIVETQGQMAMTAPCATTTGGNGAAIGIKLTAAADLTLDYLQLGNHDFALYTDDNAALACDAGTLVSCIKSNGTSSGMASFTNVPAGKYYLDVVADKPDTAQVQSSGSVSVQLAGVPHM